MLVYSRSVVEEYKINFYPAINLILLLLNINFGLICIFIYVEMTDFYHVVLYSPPNL